MMMHLHKIVMGQGSDISDMDITEQEGFENTSALLTTTAAPPSGIRGGWSGANDNSVAKQHQQSSSSRSSSSRFADNNKLLSILSIVGLILIFSNFSKMSGVSAMPRCPPNGVENVDPVDCPYGISSDYCGRKVCAKGPGQICGVGLFKLLGSCGEGLYCNCGRCTGCSMLTMECFDKTCV